MSDEALHPVCVAQVPASAGLARARSSGEHVVQFYDDDAFIARSAAEFVAAGLAAGEGVVLIATPAHRSAIERELVSRGVALATAHAAGQYQPADAVETLGRFMREGMPDPKLFERIVGGLIASAGLGRKGVRAFGEMVSLLWVDGSRAATIALETLWNNLQQTHHFSVLCAYPLSGFRSPEDAHEFRVLCDGHCRVVPAESFTGRTAPEQGRLVAELQQKAAALEKEIAAARRSDQINRQFTALVESSDDAIISKNLDGIITSWNLAAQRIFGFTADEIVGRSVLLLFPPDRENEEPMILDRLRRGERIDHYETVRRRKDGTLLDISLTVSPIRDRDGRVVGASKIARDITGRKRAERQQEALYGLVVAVNGARALDDIFAAALGAICTSQRADRAAILVCDPNGVMRFKAWRGLSDAYRAAVEGHSPWPANAPGPRPVCVSDVGTADFAPAVAGAIKAEGIGACAFIPLLSEQRLIGKFAIYYNAPHGFDATEIQPAEVMASQVSLAIQRHEATAALETLVNERTASLREAVAQMEEFSYTVSHDLRAPLRGMQIHSQALLEDYHGRLEAPIRRGLERIAENAARLDKMVLDVLTFSRISRSELRIEHVSLDGLVREIVGHYPEMQPPAARIEIGSLGVVRAHEPSLAQAVSNLLLNAVKFVAPGVQPHVRVSAERLDGSVRLWIADNGIGIPPLYQHRLFRMFERIHPQSSYEGTGVGLAIVRKAVTRMGGNVGVESDGVHGCRFWIQLPNVVDVA